MGRIGKWSKKKEKKKKKGGKVMNKENLLIKENSHSLKDF